MTNCYKTIWRGGTGEVTEKKSRFVATISLAETEAEALSFIESIKKKYWDASHNCSAYVIGRVQPLVRCSDDGEPSQTAGRPMLDVLVAEGLHNVCVTVTRYFGGTLLGTGGLVRAYQAAVKAGLAHSFIIEKQFSKTYVVRTDYSGLGKLQYLAAQLSLTIIDTKYTDIVTVSLLVIPEQEGIFKKKLQEATAGRSTADPAGEGYFSIVDGELILFPD